MPKAQKIEQIGWKIDGSFITDLARTWFWDENKPYEKCEELLYSCLGGTDQTKDQIRYIVQQIIEGRKKLVGINEFTLEDDNENVRPLSVKINEQFRKLEIERLKTHMQTYMIDYIDPYSTTKSLKAAKGYGVTDIEQCKAWFWYEDSAIDHSYIRPWTVGEGMMLDENDDTDLGLWLYGYPELVYDIISETNEQPSSPYFWEALYEKIKDNRKFKSKWFERRNYNYLAVQRMNKKKNETSVYYEPVKHDWTEFHENLAKTAQLTIDFTEEWLSEHKEPEYPRESVENAYTYKHHIFSLINHVLKEAVEKKSLDRHDRMWFLLPDEYEEWEGLIAPNGDFYSCDFGGHNAKACHLIQAFPEKFPGIDYDYIKYMDTTNALDDLLRQGWCATRYLPTMGHFIQMPLNGNDCTKAQKNAIFDAKIKHNVDVDLSCIGF